MFFLMKFGWGLFYSKWGYKQNNFTMRNITRRAYAIADILHHLALLLEKRSLCTRVLFGHDQFFVTSCVKERFILNKYIQDMWPNQPIFDKYSMLRKITNGNYNCPF